MVGGIMDLHQAIQARDTQARFQLYGWEGRWRGGCEGTCHGGCMVGGQQGG